MPKRTDIEKILILGSGPIVIGQACEFDYSGTQACKAIREEGYEVILLNSNPATIMTDPVMADKTYVEPITVDALEKVLKREKPDAMLATLGGQTALNVAVQAWEAGILDKYSVDMIGADYDAIQCAEDRDLFRTALQEIGVDIARSRAVRNLKDAEETAAGFGFPVLLRPSFTLGGTGASIAYNAEEFREAAALSMELSLINEVLVEESILGWKEYELEVMRDKKDNVVIICAIENLDPMGIHTGDSITVAPAQTLTDAQYQKMRDDALKIIRRVGVETGGSNIQFAVCPETGRMVTIEMNPRVSRSSALASKATGFPIAKFAAKLALGYTLDEIPNDITQETPACFEPSIDYCVTKIPRFTFEKFADTDDTLNVSMKSVGETMAIGRTFKESLQKGLRGLETGLEGLGQCGDECVNLEKIADELRRPNINRLFYVKAALKNNMSVDEIYKLSRIDPWFINNIADIVRMESQISDADVMTPDLMRNAKRYGFSDPQLGRITGQSEEEIRAVRKEMGIKPTYKLVDTCAAEFEAYTPYYYSTYGTEDESRSSDKPKILIIGGGPNRIGQGLEFDYCCVHASLALRELGYDTIMVNSNPETVSTDYDISSRLYFEPLTYEDVLNIIESERPEGIIVQLGGQTPLNLANRLAEAGVTILGTSPEAIDRAEDRKMFRELIEKLGLKQAPSDTAVSYEGARKIAADIGYPVLVRPSYVLGGRAMVIAWKESELEDVVSEALKAGPGHPILIDKFLDDAIEADVDAVSDGKDVIIGGVMEHIEEAGVHSGDSAMVLPVCSLNEDVVGEIKTKTRQMALELGVVGLMNVQFAVKDGEIYVLEINPRASRTVPFVSKATGLPLAMVASKAMAGISLAEQGGLADPEPPYYAVKESVLPFSKFRGSDPVLSPEMKSTGEVMGIDSTFALAFAKSQISAGLDMPPEGKVFISVREVDKASVAAIARVLRNLDYELLATSGTAAVLHDAGLEVQKVPKIAEGRPNILDFIKSREVGLIINTPSGPVPHKDEIHIRGEAVRHNVALVTTMAAARACVGAIEALEKGDYDIRSLQEIHREEGNVPDELAPSENVVNGKI